MVQKPQADLIKSNANDFRGGVVRTWLGDLGYEVKLLSAIEETEHKVKAASQAKYKTIQAINEHSRALKKAVDDGQHADWPAVSKALANADKLSKAAILEESSSRNSLDSLRKLLTEAKSVAAMAGSNLILVASETGRKLNRQLDEVRMTNQC